MRRTRERGDRQAFTVRIDKDVWKAASHAAIDQEIPLQDLIEQALRRHLKLPDKEPAPPAAPA